MGREQTQTSFKFFLGEEEEGGYHCGVWCVCVWEGREGGRGFSVFPWFVSEREEAPFSVSQVETVLPQLFLSPEDVKPSLWKVKEICTGEFARRRAATVNKEDSRSDCGVDQTWAAVYQSVARRIQINTRELEHHVLAPTEPSVDIEHIVRQARGEHQSLFHIFSRHGAKETPAGGASENVHSLGKEMPGAQRSV